MRNVFMKFAWQIFKDVREFPNYERMDRYITAQINNLLALNQPNEPVFFTWMDQDDIEEALEHISSNPIPNIQTDIKDPRQINLHYPDVDFDHFIGTTTS